MRRCSSESAKPSYRDAAHRWSEYRRKTADVEYATEYRDQSDDRKRPPTHAEGCTKDDQCHPPTILIVRRLPDLMDLAKFGTSFIRDMQPTNIGLRESS